jgi:hypothetical protein
MANTGNKITYSLKLYDQTASEFVDPAVVKPNVPGDPDYVPITTDLVTCPVNTAFSCVRVATSPIPGTNDFMWEFSLPSPVLGNVALERVDIILKNSVPAVVTTINITDFDPNYYSGTFTGLVAEEDYTIDLVYKTAGGSVLFTCTAAGQFTTLPTVPEGDCVSYTLTKTTGSPSAHYTDCDDVVHDTAINTMTVICTNASGFTISGGGITVNSSVTGDC